MSEGMPDDAPKVATGDAVGKYRVDRVIGQGAMGVVVAATNVESKARVALKLLAPGTDTPAALGSVLEEARATSSLKSAHVARVHDVAIDPTHGPYIVMELLTGRSLAALMARPERLAVESAVRYVVDACEGLAAAHAAGIVHEDLKPSSLFVTNGKAGTGSVKLLDFGIANMRVRGFSGSGNIDLRVSSAGPVLGTPFYLAPEQLRADASADRRSDIWALGCVLFELLTGQKAFSARRFTNLIVQVLESPRAAVPESTEVPAALLAIVDRCIEKDPAKRYASVEELAKALEPFAGPRDEADETPAPAPSRPVPVATIALVAAAALVLAWLVLR